MTIGGWIMAYHWAPGKCLNHKNNTDTVFVFKELIVKQGRNKNRKKQGIKIYFTKCYNRNKHMV